MTLMTSKNVILPLRKYILDIRPFFSTTLRDLRGEVINLRHFVIYKNNARCSTNFWIKFEIVLKETRKTAS